jgi:hypothetical protein
MNPINKNNFGKTEKNFLEEEKETQRINYEILPIEELRKQAKKLMVENYLELNKQKLIDAIRNAKKAIK